MQTDLEEEPCRLVFISRVLGLPDGVALSVVLHRIRKLQEASARFAERMH